MSERPKEQISIQHPEANHSPVPDSPNNRLCGKGSSSLEQRECPDLFHTDNPDPSRASTVRRIDIHGPQPDH